MEEYKTAVKVLGRLKECERALYELSPNIEDTSWMDRSPRHGEIANLIMVLRSTMYKVIEGNVQDGKIEEIEERLRKLKEDPESAGKHDEILKQTKLR